MSVSSRRLGVVEPAIPLAIVGQGAPGVRGELDIGPTAVMARDSSGWIRTSDPTVMSALLAAMIVEGRLRARHERPGMSGNGCEGVRRAFARSDGLVDPWWTLWSLVHLATLGVLAPASFLCSGAASTKPKKGWPAPASRRGLPVVAQCDSLSHERRTIAARREQNRARGRACARAPETATAPRFRRCLRAERARCRFTTRQAEACDQYPDRAASSASS